MTKKTEQPAKAATLDDAALDDAVGGTGGRFMLDISGHNIGFDRPTAPPPPPPKPPKP